MLILLVGKHVPPPISPIITFKSTTTTSSVKVGSSGLAEDKNEKIPNSTTLAASNSSTTCAWRIPKVAEPPVNQSSNYPQRKVPELTPVTTNINAVKEPEKPKSFLERFEEFPNLLKQHQTSTVTPATASTTAATISTSCDNNQILLSLPQRPPQKLLGGDFNFLEDDDWLEGDNIDYSQNLFEGDDHFLPSYILEETIKQPVISDNTTATTISSSGSLCHVKAKTLLAERHHSSKKTDIWKRTDEQQPKMKIKILKRPEQPVIKEENNESVTAATAELAKKISTSLQLKEIETAAETTLIVEEPPKQQPSRIKIVYSSASKKLQKM